MRPRHGSRGFDWSGRALPVFLLQAVGAGLISKRSCIHPHPVGFQDSALITRCILSPCTTGDHKAAGAAALPNTCGSSSFCRPRRSEIQTTAMMRGSGLRHVSTDAQCVSRSGYLDGCFWRRYGLAVPVLRVGHGPATPECPVARIFRCMHSCRCRCGSRQHRSGSIGSRDPLASTGKPHAAG
jgi:hypothetical protein